MLTQREMPAAWMLLLIILCPYDLLIDFFLQRYPSHMLRVFSLSIHLRTDGLKVSCQEWLVMQFRHFLLQLQAKLAQRDDLSVWAAHDVLQAV
jgi:hypothetical protein